jgi:hypothetical protein
MLTTCAIHATARAQTKAFDEVRVGDERLGRFLHVVQVPTGQQGPFDEQFSRRSERNQVVVILGINDPETARERSAEHWGLFQALHRLRRTSGVDATLRRCVRFVAIGVMHPEVQNSRFHGLTYTQKRLSADFL